MSLYYKEKNDLKLNVSLKNAVDSEINAKICKYGQISNWKRRPLWK